MFKVVGGQGKKGREEKTSIGMTLKRKGKDRGHRVKKDLG